MAEEMWRHEALAPYATLPRQSKGAIIARRSRRAAARSSATADRIIHSTAFRRLKHKTQVFVFHEGDHYRTRLTHSLEVAQITRTICRVLRLDEDLGEAQALAHDLGHTPFGHAGEEALHGVMAPYAGFGPQRPDPAHPHQARGPPCRVQRAEPHLGGARGRGEA